MFKSLQIKNFRLFREFEIEELGTINLLSGRNNCGKTTLLEALYLLSGAGNPDLVRRIAAFRGVKRVRGAQTVVQDTYWKPLFREFDVGLPLEIIAHHRALGRLTLTMSVERKGTLQVGSRPTDPRQLLLSGFDLSPSEMPEPWELCLEFKSEGSEPRIGRAHLTTDGLSVTLPEPFEPIPGVFVASGAGGAEEDAGRLDQIRKRKEGKLVTEALRGIEPRLLDVETSSATGHPMIWADVGLSELIPLQFMGEGMSYVASIVLAIQSARGGVILVDEVSRGIHHSVLKDFWILLSEVAQRSKVQIFASTHSHECVVAAHQTLGSELRYLRLDRTHDGDIRPITYSDEALDAAIEHDLEVR